MNSCIVTRDQLLDDIELHISRETVDEPERDTILGRLLLDVSGIDRELYWSPEFEYERVCRVAATAALYQTRFGQDPLLQRVESLNRALDAFEDALDEDFESVYTSLREISRTSELLLSYVNLGVEEVLRECARYLKACLPEE